MIIWIDVETTGLDERTGHLLEVALVVTDDMLSEVASKSCVIYCEPKSLEGAMDAFVTEMHTDNGLLKDVAASTNSVMLAQSFLLGFVWQHVSPVECKDVPLAGSTIGFDRRWLRHHMPALEGMFSHRSIDVSSFTEMAKRWAPQVYEGRPKKGEAHRALADVRESIAYMRYYGAKWFGAPRPWEGV